MKEFNEKQSPYYWQTAQRNLNQALTLIAERKAQAKETKRK